MNKTFTSFKKYGKSVEAGKKNVNLNLPAAVEMEKKWLWTGNLILVAENETCHPPNVVKNWPW